MRTEGHSTTDVFGFARYIQASPTGSCGNDNCRCGKDFVALHLDLLFFSLEVSRFDATIFEQFNRIMGEVCTQVVGQFVSCSIRYRYQILDSYGFFYLTTNAFSNHSYLQSLTCRIDCCRCSSRSSTQYQHIKVSVDWCTFIVSFFRNRWIKRFQLFQQFAHRTTPRMNHLSFGIYSWNCLYSKLIHFRLEECSIHHFVTDAWIK